MTDEQATEEKPAEEPTAQTAEEIIQVRADAAAEEKPAPELPAELQLAPGTVTTTVNGGCGETHEGEVLTCPSCIAALVADAATVEAERSGPVEAGESAFAEGEPNYPATIDLAEGTASISVSGGCGKEHLFKGAPVLKCEPCIAALDGRAP